MKLGSDTTNYYNYLLAMPRSDEPTPAIGQPATVLRRHDRVGCTVIELLEHNGRSLLKVQEDKLAPASDSLSEAQDGFERDPNGKTYVFFKSEAGYWQHIDFNKRQKRWEHLSAFSLYLGERLVSDSAVTI